MITDIWKLKDEEEERSREVEQLKTELAKKESGMTELQTQLGMIKMEDQVQAKQLQKKEKRSCMKLIGKPLT